MKTVAIFTMGCRANQADSAILEGMLAREGWRLVDTKEPADAYILNTCTVTNNADQEARYLIRRLHRQNPEACILVTGCSAQVNPKALAGVEGVAFVVGNTQKKSILDLLKQSKPLVPEIMVEDIFQEEAIFSSDFSSYSKNTRALLKIQDGCNQMCSYCVIPFARGKNRSLLPQLVMDELHRLSEIGYYEAVLTGIHIGTYGRDLSPQTDLLALMKRIEDEVPIHRVRLSSIDPEEVTEEMIEFLSGSKIFCAHLHIPVQSGEDQILKLMRRRYTAQEFLDLGVKLKEKIPGVCLGTDIMPGFPYENEERFEKSYRLMQESPLDYLHVFPYSAKEKTRAANFQDQVSQAQKRERVSKMTALSKEKRNQFYESQKGSIQEIILEEKAMHFPEHFSDKIRGVSRNFISVYVVANEDLKGKLVSCKITGYEGDYVFGEII
ncbi:MAG: tRNA (N(6)-L-threonylcarbamoyladenosine(37)-C(2))-methylthiotransferase MtaB [Deltaproteobacteria bacterium]|nr:tRNA (N(6)-L-threonylcarbamoyladenosine(37)-C(2))-methylthiotransferase MtaB [Deltaproteobacteria bacterium]